MQPQPAQPCGRDRLRCPARPGARAAPSGWESDAWHL